MKLKISESTYHSRSTMDHWDTVQTSWCISSGYRAWLFLFLQSAQAATDEAIQSLREENDLLKRQLNENDEQRQRILEAAAAGQLPLGPGTPIRDIAGGAKSCCDFFLNITASLSHWLQKRLSTCTSQCGNRRQLGLKT